VRETIVQWPNGRGSLFGKTQDKVPTEILYNSGGDGNKVKWGFQIGEHEQRHQWFKLGLDTAQPGQASYFNVRYPEPKALPPAYDRDSVQLTTDYLTCLREHAVEVLTLKLGSGIVNSTPLRFVITVPAIWDDAAKARTAECAVRAGMGDDIRIVTEPEAAILYSLDAMDPHGFKVGDTFVLCDAGGGTVDLISYEIESLVPCVKVREAAPGTGAACGSTFLNRIFAKHLDDIFKNNDQWDDEIMQGALDAFENLKRDFTGDEQPLIVPVMGIDNDPALGINRGRMSLPVDKVKDLFEPIIANVVGLVQAQIKSTKKRSNAVLLVGGFGRNMYLHKCIQQVVGAHIEVLQPPHPWTAVVQGALLWGLNDSMPGTSRIDLAVRKARKAYGLKINRLYCSDQHDAAHK
jgi:hypothetical protein